MAISLINNVMSACASTKADIVSVVRAQGDFLRNKIYKPLQGSWAGRNVAIPSIAVVSFFLRLAFNTLFVLSCSAILFINNYSDIPVNKQLDEQFEEYISADIDEDEPVEPQKPAYVERFERKEALKQEAERLERDRGATTNLRVVERIKLEQ